ncbi:GntR family transcriptional regulator [Mycobacterium sp. AT1]|uniref:GntR family transcriptional regulator n=1 Tax=Mycobacterium sp. AT1 TaxID=1961706 RepID=UPI001301FA8C|nr:GntR family transcriptional regulator [Mycobacterium sp. AT1]
MTEQVYHLLKEDILLARWKPDSSLVESELAQLYRMSKTPVREALRLLVRDGLVTVLPRKGYLVRSISLGDTREIFGLRNMIEPELATDAARFASEAGIAKLSALVTRQREESDLDASLNAARLFHLEIAEQAHNQRAAQVLLGLLDEIRRLHHLMPSVEGHIWSNEEVGAHAEILSAVQARDTARARELMKRHLDEVSRTMLSSLTSVRLA